MSKDIEDAVREVLLSGKAVVVRTEPGADKELACQLHLPALVVHRAADPCPLCHYKPDPKAIVAAVHALSTAPAPFHQVLEAVRSIAPFVEQLRSGKGLMALGHTVADVERLGKADTALQAWLNVTPGLDVEAMRRGLKTLTKEQRAELMTDYCVCGSADTACQCWNDD